ncbi:hypothetical protein SAMN05216389_101161 [Oceanobacillus limi]|uniref:Phosphotransferase enzyme family protein n=1 Tax=Oceanobacillus limi TaxID=930131 RepID=A0A1H9Y3B2_9BACI|nr:hypothetical protein [Oceanobacillus limi]SES63212.1 hypothetical protein SAMN05216389_101161 [Oceanobacillus limi]
MDIALYSALKRLKLENIMPKKVCEIDEGAWHTVYKLEGLKEGDLVLRLKKKRSYGEILSFDRNELFSEYESTRAYYRHANESYLDACPTFYKYFIDEDVVFTVETFMGTGRDLSILNKTEAFFYGEKLGYIFRKIHSKDTVIDGFGDLYFNGEHLHGSDQQTIEALWKEDNNNYLKVLNELNNSFLDFNKDKVTKKIECIIRLRETEIQRVSFVNQDITPENIIFNRNQVFIIDPFPRIDFDLKYAGFFVFCYKFLLPSFSNAPRYSKNSYDKNRNILHYIADGYIKGYFHEYSSDAYNAEVEKLMNEYTLWMLQEAYEHYLVLNTQKISSKTIQQMGSRRIIEERLVEILSELEVLCT